MQNQKNSFLWIFVIICLRFTPIFAAELDDCMTSRFILVSDESNRTTAGFSLPTTWWSRPYEYTWAAKFTGSQLNVLDAACGVSHPFKWLLGMTCKKTWACDLDSRLIAPELLKKEILDDLGQDNYNQFIKNSHMFKNVELFLHSICSLPDSLPLLDRIFCISTLEHMTPTARKQALSEFARKLSPDGLVVITMDYPLVPLNEFFDSVKQANLVPAGKVEMETPSQNALFSDTAIPNARLFVYRCILRHKNEE